MSGKKMAIGIVAGVVIVVGLIMVAVLSFFQENPTQDVKGSSEMTGWIIAMEDERVLVVTGSQADLQGVTNETILDSGLPAIWFRVTMDQRNKLQVGQEVKVTHNEVAESYPGQSTAVTIEVISSDD